MSASIELMTLEPTVYTIPCQILTPNDILTEMNSATSHVQTLLQTTPEQSQLILQKFNWDIESLKERFLEIPVTNTFLCEYGITIGIVTYFSECDICCAYGRVLGLGCGHVACLKCWNKYLTTQIKDGQGLLGCMNFGCNMLISNEELGKFCYDRTLIFTHQKLVMDSYVRNDSSLTWCNKKCMKAVRRSNSDIVKCSCGSEFCFLCGLDSHLPATCRQAQLWNKQRNEEKSSIWKLRNTKECPKCWAPIEKNGGCSHMTCTVFRCRYQFCWDCRQNWQRHWKWCKTFDIAAEESRLSSQIDSRSFAKYIRPFEHHEQALQVEQRKPSSIPTLVKCHRILMYSYIFGYYLKKGSYSKSFKKYQRELETAVEELTEFLKDNQENKDPRALLEKCDNFQKSLLEFCAKGVEYVDLERRQRQSLFRRLRRPLTVRNICIGFLNFIFILLILFLVLGAVASVFLFVLF